MLPVTGFWMNRTNGHRLSRLIEFLQRGPAPVYVGFGSMGSRKPEETADIVLQALVQTGQRAILSSGWGGLHAESLPESVFMLKAIPHALALPTRRGGCTLWRRRHHRRRPSCGCADYRRAVLWRPTILGPARRHIGYRARTDCATGANSGATRAGYSARSHRFNHAPKGWCVGCKYSCREWRCRSLCSTSSDLANVSWLHKQPAQSG